MQGFDARFSEIMKNVLKMQITQAQPGFYMAPPAFLSVISRKIPHDVLIMRFQGYHMKCTYRPLPGDNLTPTEGQDKQILICLKLESNIILKQMAY